MDRGAKVTVRLIGYWASPDDDSWPEAARFVDHDQDPELRARVVAYLHAGTAFVGTGGWSCCRLCGARNGALELTDGQRFVWPEGLVHYVEDHDVWLPDDVARLMAAPPAVVDEEAFVRGLLDTGEVVVDVDWWRGLRDGSSR